MAFGKGAGIGVRGFRTEAINYLDQELGALLPKVDENGGHEMVNLELTRARKGREEEGRE